ncbi:MAG: hypothetical protein ACH344_03905 [Yersinia sp. (in: enterobacteria)]
MLSPAGNANGFGCSMEQVFGIDTLTHHKYRYANDTFCPTLSPNPSGNHKLK